MEVALKYTTGRKYNRGYSALERADGTSLQPFTTSERWQTACLHLKQGNESLSYCKS